MEEIFLLHSSPSSRPDQSSLSPVVFLTLSLLWLEKFTLLFLRHKPNRHSHLSQNKGLLLFSLKSSCCFGTEGTINNFITQEAIRERSSLLSEVSRLAEADGTLDAIENHTGRRSSWKGKKWVDTKEKENQGRLLSGDQAPFWRPLSQDCQTAMEKTPRAAVWDPECKEDSVPSCRTHKTPFLLHVSLFQNLPSEIPFSPWSQPSAKKKTTWLADWSDSH